MSSTRFAGFDLERELRTHWVRWSLLAWLAIAGWYLWYRWGLVNALVLSDTDDNMRLMQVRALLAGQDWYDLRQYRLSPPGGLDIHWSRLVDLPIAALILLFQPFTGTPMAERLAVGIAPLLPLAVTMLAMGAAVRRLIAPAAWPLAIIILMGCTATMAQFVPLRIDHHGWQLAFLALAVMGIADPQRTRGGLTVGLASAGSLTIGLELLPFCAMAGAIVALRWVWGRDEMLRMRAYGLALQAAAARIVLFASNANYAMRCDALTPIWLSVMVAAGALLFALSLLDPTSRLVRLGVAGAAGGIVVAGFVGLFPNCLQRPEGVSDELATTWLNNVREARPIYKHSFGMAFPMAVLPVIGIIGAGFAAWRAKAADQLVAWVAIGLFTAFAGAMLLWQVRAGPAAQLLAVPGVVWLVWTILPWFLGHKLMAVRILGSVAAFLLVSGLFAGFVVKYLPVNGPPSKYRATVSKANSRCASSAAMRMLDRTLPPTTLFTHVDLGPRLIVMTRHKGIAGPYHRNERAILDVHHAFTGKSEAFRGIARRYGAQYLLVCPNMAETTVYRAREKNGFYGQLAKGKAPDWLEPMPLPKGAPYRLWRIRYDR